MSSGRFEQLKESPAMTAAEAAGSLHPVCSGVYRVMPMRLTPTKYSSFLVIHPAGNLMFACYSRGGLAADVLNKIEQTGGLRAQLLGDMHLKDPLCDVLSKRFHTSTYCSEPETDDVQRTCHLVTPFPFERHALFPHVEVIPTPGHRPGGTCFIVDMGGRRVLFAGDNVGFDGQRWTCFPSKQGRREMVASLRLLASCEFDVLCAITLASERTCSITLESADQRKQFFESVAATVVK